MSINTSGKPKTTDYQLGRGRVYFAFLGSDGQPRGFREVGNAPSFTFNVATELLEHASSQEGLKVIDLTAVLSQKITGGLTLDEISHDNLAMMFSGETATFSNAGAVAGVTANVAGNLLAYQKAVWYDLYQSTTGKPASNANANRIYDIGAVTVRNLAGSTTYVEGTDYEIDYKMGRIFIPEGSSMTVNASTGVGYRVDMAANASADPSPDEARALKTTTFVGAIKFISENPVNNDKQTEILIHKARIQANGDVALIGDTFTQLTFTFTAEKNTAADSNSPYVTIRDLLT